MRGRRTFWQKKYVNSLAGVKMKILKIWGIPIYKILSDTEFVEKTRKVLRFSRKFIWIHVAVLLVICVIVPAAVGLLWQLTKDSPDEARQSVVAGLIVGFIFGAFIGQYLWAGVNAILSALDLFDYNRAPRLLIEYHDLLKEMGALDDDAIQQDESGIFRANET